MAGSGVQSPFDRLEVDLVAHAAVRAGPVVGHLAPRGPGRKALAGVASLLVVDVAARRDSASGSSRLLASGPRGRNRGRSLP